MILRVWALYNQSRFILGILLTFYAIEIIPKLVFAVLGSTRSGSIGVAQIAFGALMCLLVVIQFTKEALQMYKGGQGFRLNRYMVLLVREGIIYFLALLAYAVIGLVTGTANLPASAGWLAILIGAMEVIPPFTLLPRFILSLRSLYTRDLQGVRGSKIDTAFGFSLTPNHGVAASTIMFADAGQNDGIEEGEEIRLEEREISSTGSDA
ncbi:hypothetical protein J3R83DRAFT_10741 [Lanmaoa asiatica]|nr:hypothetical protein J3R83DRAFT_10741 [Lanmaoa asiatica]